jgi:hypothetical protein
MPGDRTLFSLDASHAILTRVLRYEDFGLRRRTSVRPVVLTGQTSGPHWSDRYPSVRPVRPVWSCCSTVFGSSVLATKEPNGFLVNLWKPRKLGVASANRHS